MMDELFSLRVVVVAASRDRDLFRGASSSSTVPIEFIEANDAAAACRSIAGGVDLVFLDATLANGAIAQVVAAARKATKPSFSILLSASATPIPFETDALAAKPAKLEDAERLLERATRVRLPSRVLVLDDSSTMRSIVRKVLTATRMPLEISEVEQGMEAIELARKIDFDIVFLDYNLPGFSGLETMAEFRREKRTPTFVLITSTQDDTVALRARAYGAAFLKKPFFPADIEALLCNFYGLRALNPKRV